MEKDTDINIEDMLDALADFIKKDKKKLTRMRKELNELLDVPLMADEVEDVDD